jgi:hypothetical protein
MKKFTKILFALTVAVALCLPGMAFAYTAISFTSTNPATTLTNNPNWSLGWEFTTGNSSVTVESLGFFYESGTSASHEVGIFSAGTPGTPGTQLVSTNVTATDPVSGFFRWGNLSSPYVLSANTTYYMAAVTGIDAYTYSPNGFTVNPAINFIGAAYTYPPPGTLTFPDYTITGLQGYFGPNFATNTVPIPGAVWLLGSGLVGLAGLRRKFKR